MLRKMNQTIGCLAIIAAFIGLVGRTSADVNLSLNHLQGAPGETAIVIIEVNDATGIAGADLGLVLPEFVLPGAAALSPIAPDFLIATRSQPGKIEISLARSTSMRDGCGALLQFPVRIGADAIPGTYPVTFTRCQLYNGTPEAISSHALAGSLTILSSLEDSDSDGLPDAWEQQYFGHLSENAETDTDQDGIPNGQESIAGTDPASVDSVFRIVRLDSTDHDGYRAVLLEWEAREGRSYKVHWSDGPLSPGMVWHEVYHPILQQNGNRMSWTDDGSRTYSFPENVALRFYRIVVE